MTTTSTGRVLAVTPGLLDESAVHLFTRGQCAALAAALVEAGLGTPVFEVNLATCLNWAGATDRVLLEAGAEHVLVRLADGRLLDAEGVYGADNYIAQRTTEHSQCLLVDMDSAEFLEFVRSGTITALDMVPQNVDLAQTFVPAVVDAFL